MGKPMLRVGLLAWATSCGGLDCAVAADNREVPDVDHYVEKSEHIVTSRHGMSQDRPEAAHKIEVKSGLKQDRYKGRTPSESPQN